jgi:hypothetical protein
MGFLINRRWFWLFLLFVFIVAGGTLILVASLSKDPVQQKFAKIQRGMTREQVVEIMGSEPPGPRFVVDFAWPLEIWQWRLGDEVIEVWLQDNKVQNVQMSHEPTIIDKVRLWIMSWLV